MIPELGHFALILALLVAATQSKRPLLGAAQNQPSNGRNPFPTPLAIHGLR